MAGGTINRADKERRLSMLEAQVEAFILRWKPEDRHEHARFAAELTMLVHRIWADATERYQSVLSNLAMTSMPMILKEEPRERSSTPKPGSAPDSGPGPRSD